MTQPATAHVTKAITEHATRLGFHRVGVMEVAPPRRLAAFRAWVKSGHGADMSYLTSQASDDNRGDIRKLAENARTVVVVALAYAPPKRRDAPDNNGTGFIASYARGNDYHVVLKHKLRELADRLSASFERPVAARPCVDTAPVLERDYAETAGLGFIGKNTMLISPGLGSYTVLGELLLDLPAEPTIAAETKGCGECTACLDVCPTQAFPAPYTIDARRCISYLTIESQNAIPDEFRDAIGTRIFGCDDCQDVCPYNAAAPFRTVPAPELTPRSPDYVSPALLDLLMTSGNQRKKFVDGTAMRRVNRAQLLRNLCIAVANAGLQQAVPRLYELATEDKSELVRQHAASALKKLGAQALYERALDKTS